MKARWLRLLALALCLALLVPAALASELDVPVADGIESVESPEEESEPEEVVAAEDETDLSRIDLSLELMRAYTAGFLAEVREEMTPEEIQSLPWGARMMTLENGVRFLTDYLDGDKYFAVHRPHHNLDRARAQLTLLTRMEEKWEEMLAALS